MLQPGMLQAECQLSALHCKAYNDWAQAHFAEDCSQQPAAGCGMPAANSHLPRSSQGCWVCDGPKQ